MGLGRATDSRDERLAQPLAIAESRSTRTTPPSQGARAIKGREQASALSILGRLERRGLRSQVAAPISALFSPAARSKSSSAFSQK
jgi:hypothetical protein